MGTSEKVKKILECFVDSKTVSAVEAFTAQAESGAEDINVIAQMFGFSGDFFTLSAEDEKKLITSFKHNLQLLIQKTWVEKSDILLKEQILFQLDKICDSYTAWQAHYSDFLEIIANAVYLMFGQQTKSDDFCEYCLRIDPEFGIFWWYIQNLPRKPDWTEDKCRNAMLLGMYFLANY
ncbi:MAG: hypothetical protein K2H09_03160 [Treponemataceae bacterium]|nr:hypothetical protein [Treponemataceae bacterium]